MKGLQIEFIKSQICCQNLPNPLSFLSFPPLLLIISPCILSPSRQFSCLVEEWRTGSIIAKLWGSAALSGMHVCTHTHSRVRLGPYFSVQIWPFWESFNQTWPKFDRFFTPIPDLTSVKNDVVLSFGQSLANIMFRQQLFSVDCKHAYTMTKSSQMSDIISEIMYLCCKTQTHTVSTHVNTHIK